MVSNLTQCLASNGLYTQNIKTAFVSDPTVMAWITRKKKELEAKEMAEKEKRNKFNMANTQSMKPSEDDRPTADEIARATTPKKPKQIKPNPNNYTPRKHSDSDASREAFGYQDRDWSEKEWADILKGFKKESLDRMIHNIITEEISKILHEENYVKTPKVDKQKRQQELIDIFHQYPHYFVEFINNNNLFDYVGKEPSWNTVVELTNQIWQEIESNSTRKDMLKAKLCHLLEGNRTFSALLLRFTEDYMYIKVKHQSVIDKLANNENFSDEDKHYMASAPIDWYSTKPYRQISK